MTDIDFIRLSALVFATKTDRACSRPGQRGDGNGRKIVSTNLKKRRINETDPAPMRIVAGFLVS